MAGSRYSERELVEEVEGIVYINSLELPPDDDEATWDELYKIGLPGKSILGDYFQENMTS